jgi:hypothetical protein
VPSIYTPVGQTLSQDAYWLYEWVGLDSSCGVILQAGTGAYVSKNKSNYPIKGTKSPLFAARRAVGYGPFSLVGMVSRGSTRSEHAKYL